MLIGKGFKQFSISLSIMQLSNYTVPLPMKTKSVNYFRCPRHYQKENGLSHTNYVTNKMFVKAIRGKTLITHTGRERVHR